jgi:hypothetical protein
VRVKIRVNQSGVRAAGRSNSVYRELERRAGRVVQLAQAIAPEDTGEYKRSFRVERTRVRGKAAVEVSNTSNHAMIVEFGSGPHVIEPREKQALYWPGAAHPVRRVNHPGTPAFHVMRRALRAAGS